LNGELPVYIDLDRKVALAVSLLHRTSSFDIPHWQTPRAFILFQIKNLTDLISWAVAEEKKVNKKHKEEKFKRSKHKGIKF